MAAMEEEEAKEEEDEGSVGEGNQEVALAMLEEDDNGSWEAHSRVRVYLPTTCVPLKSYDKVVLFNNLGTKKHNYCINFYSLY